MATKIPLIIIVTMMIKTTKSIFFVIKEVNHDKNRVGHEITIKKEQIVEKQLKKYMRLRNKIPKKFHPFMELSIYNWIERK